MIRRKTAKTDAVPTPIVVSAVVVVVAIAHGALRQLAATAVHGLKVGMKGVVKTKFFRSRRHKAAKVVVLGVC